jgi:hypothetical protein
MVTAVTPNRRPLFARAFPRDPELDALVEAFERGDYARVREEGPKVGAASADEGIKGAARVLVDRTKPDAVAVGLLVLGAMFVGLLSAWWIAHGHPPPGPASPVEYVH